MLGVVQSREAIQEAARRPSITGTDWSWSRVDVSALRQRGIGFACRYLSYDTGKNLSLPEAVLLTSVGIAIVSNWETTANRADVAGYDGGVSDAREGLRQHLACGGPLGRPIYFSVDIDTTVGPRISDYFTGVKSVMGVYSGAYGSVAITRELRRRGLAFWTWQTYAWSGGIWDPDANIRQYLNSQKIGNMDVDYNESMTPDFGQWMVGQKAPTNDNHNSSQHTDKAPSPDPHDPNFQRMVRACQSSLNFTGSECDGIWGKNTEYRGELVRQAGLHGPGNSDNVSRLQRDVLRFTGRDVDGVVGPKTLAAWSNVCRRLQNSMFVPADGIWGPKTDAAFRVMSPYV